MERLDEAFAEMGIRFAPTKTCEAMKGLITEGDDVIGASGDSVAIDAALIGAAQRIEQYEIGAYGTARALAGELHLDRTSALLDQTLDEEGKANKALTKLASGGMLSSGINRIAAERSESEPVEGEPAPGAASDDPVVTRPLAPLPRPRTARGRFSNRFVWAKRPVSRKPSRTWAPGRATRRQSPVLQTEGTACSAVSHPEPSATARSRVCGLIARLFMGECLLERCDAVEAGEDARDFECAFDDRG